MILMVLTGCLPSPTSYWDISEFNIEPIALKNNDTVKVLYYCSPGGKNKDLDCYMHLIVIKKATGDTVNVLSPVIIRLKNEDRDKDYVFLSQDDIGMKAILIDPDSFSKIDNVKDLKPLVPHFKKVYRLKGYDYLAHNKYPSIIGIVAKLQPDGTYFLDSGE